jgi:hypothetical protein
VGSRKGEDTSERPDEAEEEEEDMATEEGGFLPMASMEQEDEEANCSARLNKGDIVEI